MSRSSSFRAVVLGALVFAAGCSDLPTAPEPEFAPSHGLVGDLVGVLGRTVDTTLDVVVGVLSPVLNRSEPLRRDEVVSATIGRNGGTIRLPRAGLTVTIPRGALSSNTRITVTAPAGDLMGYEFAPHGLQFEKPVTLTQEITRREAANGLEGIYFEGELQPTVTVLEVKPVTVSRDHAIFRIDHFSGYGLRRRGYVVATD
jgi:hypothetical protein